MIGCARPVLECRGVAAAFGLAVLAASCTSAGGESKQTGSTQRVPAALSVSSYSVTYRVNELDRLREERVVVRRPYESRRTSVREGETVSGTLSNRQGLWQWSGGPEGGWQLVDPGRHRAEADARPLEALPSLVEAGVATIEGTDSVVGRRCAVVRTGGPLGSAATTAPTERDHAELCLDRTGIMLRERWVIDGRIARHREAAKFSLDASLHDQAFEAAPVTATDSRPPSGKQLVPVTDAVLESLIVAVDLPPDIDADGVDAWLTRDPMGRVTGGSVRRFFRRGSDLAELEERETAAVSIRRDLRFRTPLGEGFLESNLHHVTVRVPIERGVTVIVHASTLELLHDLVRGLRHQDAVARGFGPRRERTPS